LDGKWIAAIHEHPDVPTEVPCAAHPFHNLIEKLPLHGTHRNGTSVAQAVAKRREKPPLNRLKSASWVMVYLRLVDTTLKPTLPKIFVQYCQSVARRRVSDKVDNVVGIPEVSVGYQQHRYVDWFQKNGSWYPTSLWANR
jgi:hypothetical protein